MSLGFTVPDGTIVVSDDINNTPQRTVVGATPPQMDHCDVLVLESIYGARLHPILQAEEMCLAQDVANGLAPDDVSITGKPSVYQDTRRISVCLSEPLSVEAIEEIQGKFAAETGWKVDVKYT